MGVEFQFVDDESKTYFDLGKGGWPEVFGESLPFTVGGAEQLVLLLGDAYKDIAPRVWKYIENHPKAELRNDYADDIPDEYRLAGTTDEVQTNIGRTFAEIYGLDEEDEPDDDDIDEALSDAPAIEGAQDFLPAEITLPSGTFRAKVAASDVKLFVQRQAEQMARRGQAIVYFTKAEIAPKETVTIKIYKVTTRSVRNSRQWMDTFDAQHFDRVEVFKPQHLHVDCSASDGCIVENVKIAGRDQLAGPVTSLVFQGSPYTSMLSMDSGKLDEFEIVVSNPSDSAAKFMVQMEGMVMLASSTAT